MRVLIADDDATVRSALGLLLEQEVGLKVVGEAAEAAELLNQMRMTCANMLLIDWELPGLDAAELVLEVRMCCPDAVIVALSGRPEARMDALEAGIDMFVSKAEPPERLLDALHAGQRLEE
jgi:DNA-binding NarL/FixJ family response regulator